MKTAFVTGATGFIGTRLVAALLSRGVHVRALVRSPDRAARLPARDVEIIEGDLANTGALGRGVAHSDAVFHLAALTRSPHASELNRANVDGSVDVVAACLRAAGAPKLIFVSSQAAGGPSADGSPVDERSAPRPVSAYGVSKLAAERAVETRAGLLDFAIVRPPSVYGPGDVAFLPLFKLARAGLVPIPRGLGGMAVVHVDDLVAGLILVAERGAGTYYFTDGVQHTGEGIARAVAAAVSPRARVIRLPAGLFAGTARIVEDAARLAGRRPPITRDRVADATASNWVCSDARARTEIGYVSLHTLEAGMRETADWYRSAGWL